MVRQRIANPLSPGSTPGAASRVIYALEVHPFALKEVQKTASRNALTNVRTIKSNCKTGLPGDHVDRVMLSDTLPYCCINSTTESVERQEY